MSTKGFGKVMLFTIRQQIKTGAFKAMTIITLLLVILMSAAVNIIPAFISKSNEDAPETLAQVKLDRLYFYNETNIGTGVVDSLSAELKNTEIKQITDPDKIAEALKTSTSNELLLKLTKNENGYSLLSIKPPLAENVDDGDLVLYYTSTLLETLRLTESGVAPENLETVMTPIQTESIYADKDLENPEEEFVKMFLPMIIGLGMFLLIYMYGYWVATSIVTEKSSRVMEILLTSVKPVAVMLGKLLGMGILAISQFALIILSAGASYKISETFAGKISENYDKLDLSMLFSGINPASLAAVIICFIIGYIFYAEINAIAGATVNNSEDMQMAVTPVNILAVIGFYLAYMAPSIGNEVVTNLALLLPISSPFYLPSAILLGETSLGMIALSVAILAISTVLIFLFATRIYHAIILHTGTRLKISDLFRIYKQK